MQHPPETLVALNRAREYLVDFQIVTNADYIPNWHHEIIGRELEKIEKNGDQDYKILVVTVPPRHGKSQQCSIDFPAWFLGRNPTKEIITASYSADLAQDFGSKTREKVDSPVFQAVFPGVTLREDERARGHWRTKQGGGYISAGVGGSITGRGANILLIDDPIKNREEAESDVQRRKVWDWFRSTAYTRLSPKGVVILILTRWHLQDLAGMILQDKNLRTKLIRFEAVSSRKELFRSEGEALWPVQYPLEALEETKRTIGPYDWSALYQGSPVLTEDQEFKPMWIHQIDPEQLEYQSTRKFLTIDTAISKKARADSTGFCDNTVNDQNFWHLKAWRQKLSPEELIAQIFALYQTRKYDAIGIERTSYTEGLKPYLDMEQRRRNVFLPIVELSHNQTAKEIRIRGLIPRYASHSIYHIKDQCHDLEEEMFSFPMGLHDDVIDATAYQLQLADQPYQASVGMLTVSLPDYEI